MPVDRQKVGTSVIPGGLDAQEVVRRSEAACAALSDDEDGLKRDILAGHWAWYMPLASAALCAMPNCAEGCTV